MEGDWRALQSLKLNDNLFGTEEALVLAAAVTVGRLGALTSLSLTEDAGYSEGYFAALLSVPWKGLVELGLGGCPDDFIDFPEGIAQELVAAVQKDHLPSLKTLGLSNFFFERRIYFDEIFPPNTWLNLENLHLTDSHICLEEVVGLAAVAEYLPKLLELILTYKDHRYCDPRRNVPYGGLEGFKILFNAPWKSLTRFEFTKTRLLPQDLPGKWKAIKNHPYLFVVERIDD